MQFPANFRALRMALSSSLHIVGGGRASKFNGLQHASKFKPQLDKAIKLWKRKPKGTTLQKLCYNTLHNEISKCGQWTNFISGKLDTLDPTGSQGITFTIDMWDHLRSDIRKSPSPTQTCFLKTVINSWATHPTGMGKSLCCHAYLVVRKRRMSSNTT